MATYKAEFLSHYYKYRLRPVHAYAFGLIHTWSRLAQFAPSVANFFTRAPVVSGLAKKLIGVAPQRQMPPFASQTFKAWFKARPVHNRARPRVILWPDTFNNFFHPETAKAAVDVLEHAGFQVVVPEADLCCGRPLYDYGMLDTAKRWLAQIVRVLRSEIEIGTPLVGLEPSCTAVFRDELLEQFPQDVDARRLEKQTFTLAEFLMKHAPDFQVPKLQRKAILHGHCHQHAIMKTICEVELLKEMGVEVEHPPSGCCGMAGGFGFERDHYSVSVACGERILLPLIRKQTRDTLIIADGFSCREQVRQLTDRVPLHTAQVLKMAISCGPRGPAGNYPEQEFITGEPAVPSLPRTMSLLGAGATALLIGALVTKRGLQRKG
jgi:Fe-S oxidoreductase